MSFARPSFRPRLPGLRLSFLAPLAAGLALLVLTSCSPAPEANHASADSDKSASSGHYPTYPASDFQLSSTDPRPTDDDTSGVLRVAIGGDTANLDPHAVSAAYIQWFGRLVFDNLIYLDAEGNPTPWLAKSWDISPDGLTYTFRLRDDVTFSDGAKFNADAVLANLEHMRDPATKSPLAARYIVPYERGEIVDEFTFRAHLREPYAPFLDVLAQSWLAILSPKSIHENPKSLATAPVGSGPFVLDNYTRQQSLRLSRRADYHWAPAYLRHEGPARLARVEIDIISEALVRAASLSSGQHDLIIDLPPQGAPGLRADPAFVVTSRVRKGIPTRVLTFNVTRAPFDDVRVRRALALATDREGIARVAGFGELLVKSDFLAATTRHYDPSFQGVLAYDPVAAARLLDEAGWTGRAPDGIRVHASDGRRLAADLLLTETASPSAAAVALQSDLRRAGFDLHLIQLPAAQLAERRNAGDFDAISGGVWHTNTPDALYILHHTAEIPNPPVSFGQNSGRFSDPVLDDLLTRARRSLDDAERGRLYSAAQARLVEQVPAIPVYENHTLVAHSRRLHGLLYDTSHNTVVLTGAWLEAPPR